MSCPSPHLSRLAPYRYGTTTTFPVMALWPGRVQW